MRKNLNHYTKLTEEQKINKAIGRKAYEQGEPQDLLHGVYRRAGWLQAALADEDSFMNRTDSEVEMQPRRSA